MSSSSTDSHDLEVCQTVTVPDDHGNPDSQFGSSKIPIVLTESLSQHEDGEEQALESHEVIELQKFSERKAWIEEKIKFLENMPPIEVFAGLDAIRKSSEQVPGLPTRAELKQWLSEHDIIEKETEMFDSGELKKLKKFTKAATQRNLSPEDTDLIELTLTTIYQLDKLLHLLRDRSENLDLLGVRLTWEEHRVAAWADRRKLVSDLETFLSHRARWSPAAYDSIKTMKDPLVLNDSFVSTSDLSAPLSHEISRGARFKLAELLSRDAAQFIGRVTSLRHAKISSAGKALDRLIENSRKPVPEELLDEQDRLEDKGINDMEGVDKFVTNMVVQWRKADEIYVETKKDQVAAQNLLEEIQTAKLHHPTHRQSTTFSTRADALTKRLRSRSNPASSTSSFPRPVHPLFPDQQSANVALTQTLSSEITTSSNFVKDVEIVVKEYREACEAVRRVESISQDANDLSTTFMSVISRLENGVTVDHGDGTPPDLSTERCLQSTSHSVFLALLPSIVEELDTTSVKADQLLRSAHASCSILDRPGIDPLFKANVMANLQRLTSLQEQAHILKKEIISRTSRLREIRNIWSIMGDHLKEVESIRRQLGDAMETYRWRPQSDNEGAPLTPESPLAPQLPDMPPSDMAKQLDRIQNRLTQDVESPLSSISPSLEPSLNEWLMQSFRGLAGLLEAVRRMARLLETIKNQAEIMNNVRSEFEDFQIRIEDIKLGFDSATQRTLAIEPLSEEFTATETELNLTANNLRDVVQNFVDSLSQRIPFVAQRDSRTRGDGVFVKRRFSSQDLKLGACLQQVTMEVPFDLFSLDDAVRRDSNSYALRLAGELERLDQKSNHLRLALMAKEIDLAVASIIDDINLAAQKLVSFKSSLSAVAELGNKMGVLQSLRADLDDFAQTQHTRVGRSFSLIRELLRRMDSSPNAHDASVHETIYLARVRAVDDAELKFNVWSTDVQTLKSQIAEGERLEARQLEQARIQEERRLLAENQRLAEEERLRQERVRLEAEMAEERRAQAEKERQAAEEAKSLPAPDPGCFGVEEKTGTDCSQEEKEYVALGNSERQKRQREALEELVKTYTDEERFSQKRRAVEENGQADAPPKGDTADHSGDTVGEFDEDVFGLCVSLSLSPLQRRPQEMMDLLVQILALRKRLRSMNIDDILQPQSSSSFLFPDIDQARNIEATFSMLSQDVDRLPSSVDDLSVNLELRSLKTEVAASAEMIPRIYQLSKFSNAIHLCDTALSDLLEHIDSFPAPPAQLSSSHVSQTNLPPEEQLSARLVFTKALVDDMINLFAPVSDDARAVNEHQRIVQTWSELQDMGYDRVHGRKSRPGSAISSGHNSSGRNSSASSIRNLPAISRQNTGYSSLSARPSSRGQFLAPSHRRASSRRATSGSVDSRSRPPSQISNASTHRSVTGPFSSSSTLHSSTYASRQRTTSLSLTSSAQTTATRPPETPSRSRSQRRLSKRTGSPTPSDVSSQSRLAATPSRSSTSTSTSTWSRAPRLSFPTVPATSPPLKTRKKKAYIANPKNKLDVAVGDIVNKLPMNINIEVVADTWKDLSGKYWIGDQDPKLCFCRILRSQTVMVRVGGGWAELSKFIKDHFADAFRLLPDSPQRLGTQEERWISSTTLLEAPEHSQDSPLPRTPEPREPPVPAFSILTPNGKSPHSLSSTPSTSSPLKSLQFIRRADAETLNRPITPCKVSQKLSSRTPVRNLVWRP